MPRKGTPARTPSSPDVGDASWLSCRVDATGGFPFVASACRSYRLKAVALDLPGLMVPLEGTKTVTLHGQAHVCRPGQCFVLHRPETVEIRNTPDTRSGRYRAWGAFFPWRVVELARTLLNAHFPLVASASDGAVGSLLELAPLRTSVEALQACGASSAPPDPAELDHRLLGVLVAIARVGHTQFLRAGEPTLGAQVRALISGQPSRSWTSALVEHHLHLSGATLRRRLAEEGTSLREVLREARLHCALGLLQNTRKPVKAVALDCGYRSVSSFSRNFSARFGVEPSRVANG